MLKITPFTDSARRLAFRLTDHVMTLTSIAIICVAGIVVVAGAIANLAK